MEPGHDVRGGEADTELLGVRLLPLGFATFLVFGFLLVLVGANHADIATAMELDLEETGLLGASLSLGLGLGVLVAGPMSDRLPRRPLFCLATGLAGVSLLSVEADMDLFRALFHVGLAGFFAGIFETVLNVLSIEHYGERASRPVTFLHSAATLGAVIGPFVMAWVTVEAGFVAAFRATAFSMFVLSAWGLGARFLGERPTKVENANPPGEKPSLADPVLLALCVLAFSYIGVEAGLTIFAVPYAEGALGQDPESGQLAISTFWMGLLVGRLLLLASRREFEPRLFIIAGLVGFFLLAVGTGLRVSNMEIWFGVCGLALSGVFPALVTLTGRYFPQSRGTAIGLAVGSGSVGGFVIPWTIGWAGNELGIRTAVAGLALGCLLIVAAALFIRSNRKAAASL